MNTMSVVNSELSTEFTHSASLWDYLDSTNPNKIDDLVKISGNRRANSFGKICSLLLHHSALAELKDTIEKTLEMYSREDERIRNRRLSSPIYRNWLWQFRSVKNWTLSDPTLSYIVSDWWTANTPFYSPNLGDYKFHVKGDILSFVDPLATVYIPKRETVIIKRINDELLILDSKFNKELLVLDVSSSNPLEWKTKFSIQGCKLDTSIVLPESNISIRNDIPQLRIKLIDSNVPQRDSGYQNLLVDSNDEIYPHHFNLDAFTSAASILRQVWPIEYENFTKTLQVIIPRMAPKNWKMEGFTISTYQGACWINPLDTITVLESLVHEQNHVKLRYIEEAVPILKLKQTNERFSVGWRSDKRPIVGIYEGVYVHIFSARALEKAMDSPLLTNAERLKCMKRVKDLWKDIGEGQKILSQYARFTTEGKCFMDWLTNSLSRKLV